MMSKNSAPKNNVFYRNQNWHYPKVKSSKGIYLYDENGKEYIDACSGSAVVNIGHGNKEIAKTAANNIEKLAFAHLSRFTTDAIEECSYSIVQMCPEGMNHVYFVSGGSEATETAIKLARQYFVERDKTTSKYKIISRWNSFHGNTLGALSMTGITERRKIYEPLLADFPKIPPHYCYRCPYDSTPSECSLNCAYELEKEINRQGPENVAAFIFEPVVGSACPGLAPKVEYFKIIREICNKYDVVMISDEVMTGFGRTGKVFGIEHGDVIPDIITTGKGLSCGYSPIGATIVNDEIFNTIMVNGSGQFIHGHTYGGNPLSSAITVKALEILKEKNLIEKAYVSGIYMLNKLKELESHPNVGEVRGKGMLFGIEFVQDKQTKKPFSSENKVKNLITQFCLDEGVVLYPGGGSVEGVLGDHILLAPPLNITETEINKLIKKLTTGIFKTFEFINNKGV